ncbi:MAG: hypothetical protein AAF846_04390 [Chloroflexota bacterium]
MYNSPRRPYYNRSQNMPQTAHADDAVSMDNKRFWQLLKNLRHRQAEAKIDNQQAKVAKSGK